MPKRPLTPKDLLRRLGRRSRALACAEDGATMIEFAILAVPFFALLGATLETAMVFLAGQFLDSAVQDSTRMILTGQAQNTSMTAEGFRGLICQGLYGMFDCSKLQIDVKPITDFRSASAAIDPPLDPTDPTKWKLSPTYNPGKSSEVIMVRAYYKWPTIFNFFGFSLATQSDGTRLLGAIRVFRNEPYAT
ncbi:MAG TPA: TadE family protein [Devosiaceae bacterium]|jgi:Flp pilus assembly protein TadG